MIASARAFIALVMATLITPSQYVSFMQGRLWSFCQLRDFDGMAQTARTGSALSKVGSVDASIALAMFLEQLAADLPDKAKVG